MIGVKDRSGLIIPEKKVVLIDADSLMYFSCYTSENDQILSETKLSEKIYDILNIIEETYNIEKYYIFVKGDNNFRYKIFPNYKKNRPTKPPIIDSLNKYLVDTFGAIQSHNAESDDYVFTYSQLEEYKGKCIICSVDKDMLQIPGIHYNYQRNKYINVSEEDAKYNLAVQMIMGDYADGIPGLKGYGIVRASRLLKRGMTDYQYIKTILGEYRKNCLTPKDEARLNYKLLKLHHIDTKRKETEKETEEESEVSIINKLNNREEIMIDKTEINRVIVEDLQIDDEGLKKCQTFKIEELKELGIEDVMGFIQGVLDAGNNEDFNESSEDYIKGFKYGKTGIF